MEPPGAHLPARRTGSLDQLSLAAAAAAATLIAASTGDALLVAVLLGIAAADRWSLAAAVAAGVAVLTRWGTTSLAALAGAQHVLGPAITVEPTVGAVSAGLAALALVAAPGPTRSAPAFGLAAGLVAAGPAVADVGDLEDLAVRVAAALVGTVVALATRRWLPKKVAGPLSVALGLAAATTGALV